MTRPMLIRILIAGAFAVRDEVRAKEERTVARDFRQARFVPEGGQSSELHFHDRTAPLYF